MLDPLISFFSGVSPQAGTFFLSMLPIVELSGAIPIALLTWHMPVWETIFWAVLGNWIMAVCILWTIGPISEWLQQVHPMFKRGFTWLFERTHHKFYEKHERWGQIGLFLFLAFPLPLSGSWSGAIAAYLFGMRRDISMAIILVGQITAAIITAALTVGAIKIFT